MDIFEKMLKLGALNRIFKSCNQSLVLQFRCDICDFVIFMNDTFNRNYKLMQKQIFNFVKSKLVLVAHRWQNCCY